jgi:ABC-type Fe3+-hydroxamate transport system substrate-binding protein
MIFTDQLHRKIEIPISPKRIISLVPSQSELLWDLGLSNEIAGITKFCIHPDEMFRGKPRIGGTKQVDLEKIKAINPDLIIANKEENEQEQVEELMKHYPVWISDIKTLDDALHMINSVGEITGRKEKAVQISTEIRSRFRQQPAASSHLRTAYIIWKNPYMAAGSDTFIDHLLDRCGFQNVFTKTTSRYPEITLEELAALKPALILLSSEPYPFKEKHIEEFRNTCPDAKVMLADGEMFSWYGSRLLKAPGYFKGLMAQL